MSIFYLAVLLNVSDFLYGSIAAYVNKEFTSKKFKKGLLTHGFAIFAIILASVETPLMSDYMVPIYAMVVAYCSSEAISMLEIYKTNGGELPTIIENFINSKHK